MTGFPKRDFVALVPVAILTVGAIAFLLSEVFLVSGRRRTRRSSPWGSPPRPRLRRVCAVAGAVFGRQGWPTTSPRS